MSQGNILLLRASFGSLYADLNAFKYFSLEPLSSASLRLAFIFAQLLSAAMVIHIGLHSEGISGYLPKSEHVVRLAIGSGRRWNLIILAHDSFLKGILALEN